ncbi:SPFH domain-containing protein [Bifidobacterium cuniculi]|uniref:Putative virion core protein (Lumpy skin disease virus) n=1 Tax=Bifidobacterium cuniculi TaxID=1688 RepID=A0A087AZQ4_9BIFI|nr:SPFH domain-containing protein [Bifidobacterium cuniculi]KFI64254.1 putative virion core protein (lumpy skin disease virus) [Bifidobacterium cuniculi]
MALIRAFSGALAGTFADQWLDIITAAPFDEHTVVAPGVYRETNNGRGSNTKHSDAVISNGSRIYVPENTAAFIFDQSGIEAVITQPGGYEYRNGTDSVFAGDGIGKSIFGQIGERFKYGGEPVANKRIAFVNLREIRGIKFGTPAPLIYHDRFYGTDLEIRARGMMSLKVTNPVEFIRQFVPPNVDFISFDDVNTRSQLLAEYIQSFAVALNALSDEYRISQLPAQANAIAQAVRADAANAGTWESRFGLQLCGIGIESIEFTPESRELVKQFSSNRMNVAAYENISAQAGNMAAQQRIAQGVQENGFGDAGGMMLGMGFAQGVNPMTGAMSGQTVAAAGNAGATGGTDNATAAAPSMGEQVEMLKSLKELLDAGILTQDEFDAKKQQILGL